MNLTDERWQNYHGQLASMPVGDFPTHPIMRKVMTLCGNETYLQHVSREEAEPILNGFVEHPILLPFARDCDGKRIHIASEKYIFQVCLMKREFDPSNQDILEIGGGYGGFCRIALKAFPKIKSYTMLDHPVMNGLSRNFLKDESRMQWVDIGDVERLAGRKFGLVVSNYCLSETTPEFRSVVYSKVFPNCDGVFVIDGGKGDEMFMRELAFVIHDSFGEVASLPYPAAQYINILLARRHK